MKTLISKESIILSLICMADMFSTLIMVSMGYATEQNPLMASCLQRSAWLFLAAKTASFLPFIVVVEWYRRKKPAFAQAATRAAIVLYLLAYVTITVRVNMA
ncbi:MAG: DUF5658 family protein [Armatimonadota bacterium]